MNRRPNETNNAEILQVQSTICTTRRSAVCDAIGPERVGLRFSEVLCIEEKVGAHKYRY